MMKFEQVKPGLRVTAFDDDGIRYPVEIRGFQEGSHTLVKCITIEDPKPIRGTLPGGVKFYQAPIEPYEIVVHRKDLFEEETLIKQ